MRQRTSTKQTEIIYSAYGSALMSSAPQILHRYTHLLRRPGTGTKSEPSVSH